MNQSITIPAKLIIMSNSDEMGLKSLRQNDKGFLDEHK